MTEPKTSPLERDLAALLNRHSRENFSSTPDFLLAQFLLRCLEAYEEVMRANTRWHSRGIPVPWDEKAHRVDRGMRAVQEVADSLDDVDERLRILVADAAGEDSGLDLRVWDRLKLVSFMVLNCGWTGADLQAHLLR